MQPLGGERAGDRKPNPARSAGHQRHLSAQFLFHSCHYNSPRMTDIAILGAGDLGGALAHTLARRDLARTIRLIDATGSVAAGKALDLMQAAPIEAFATRISGSTDISTMGGAGLIVVADRI